MSTILLVEDSYDLADGLITNLEMEGHDVIHVVCGDESMKAIESARPDLVILDMMLPGLDGFSVLSQLRAYDKATPVLCLTARGAEVDKVRALRGGADDYVTKPFGLMELLARVEALLRRLVPDEPRRLKFGSIEIDVAERRVCRDDQAISLSPKEFDLLLALARRPNEVVSREQLMQQVWGYRVPVVSRTVDTHVASLRSKIEDDPGHPRLIQTSWKVGYRSERVNLFPTHRRRFLCNNLGQLGADRCW